MPIYEYGCGSCEHVFEEIQRFSDPDPEQCPNCGQGNVRRLISNTSFHLKGGGWYDTNYEKTPSSKGSSPAESSSVAASDATTSAPALGAASTNTAPAVTPAVVPAKSTSTSNDAA